MREKKLKGKRYIALVRCSSAAQIDTSISAQNALVERFAQEHGMVCAGVVELAGVSGSVPGIRTDIDEIIRRKREQNDFDVVLMQDATRFTRAGIAHGMKLLYELRAAGIQEVFVKDDAPEGEEGDAIRALQFLSGKKQIDTMSLNVARGLSAALKENRTAHCKAPPYGVDRLYTTPDGTPKHIIRNLPDGTQVKLDAGTRAVIETFGQNEPSGVPNHYIKQKTERIVLIPGDPDRVCVVRAIFERHHRDGWGYGRIAQELNDRGIPSPSGKLWYTSTVRSILLNPTYLGKGLANVFTSALYYMRGHDGPVERRATLAQTSEGLPPRQVRPQTDWFERPEPALAGFLDESIRPVAEAKQQARLDAIAAGRTQRRYRSRHTDSEFILTGILTAKQGGHTMSGRRTGKPGHKWRSYAISKAFTSPSSTLPRTMIGAEPLEQAVVRALELVLLETDRLRERVEQIAAEQLHREGHRDDEVTKLNSERDTLVKRMRSALTLLDDVGREALKTDLQKWQARIRTIDNEIRSITGARPVADDPAAIADAVCVKLRALGAELSSLPPAALREVLKVFVSKLEVDLQTKAVEVEFAVPDWSKGNLAQVCLNGSLACKADGQAHPLLRIGRRLLWQRASYRICDFAA